MFQSENLTPFWKWDNAVPPELMQQALKEMDDMPLERGKLQGNRDASDDVRNSDVLMLHPIHWLCGILFNFAIHANQAAGWQRKVTVPQTIQFARYGEGQHYDWHADTNLLSPSPVIRKLTAIVLLSKKDEFEGGQLEIENYKGAIDLDQGSVIVFPSVLRHRVTPITKGVRKSATCWVFGDASW